eukprot:2783900-Rhodomonas_salina.1
MLWIVARACTAKSIAEDRMPRTKCTGMRGIVFDFGARVSSRRISKRTDGLERGRECECG